MVKMYYVLDSSYRKVYVDKAAVGSLRRIGYKIYSERII